MTGNEIFSGYSRLADSSGLKSNIKEIRLTYHEARMRISKPQSKLERLRRGLKTKSKQIKRLEKACRVQRVTYAYEVIGPKIWCLWQLLSFTAPAPG